jgi:putative ABC transport system substrate-binding protein
LVCRREECRHFVLVARRCDGADEPLLDSSLGTTPNEYADAFTLLGRVRPDALFVSPYAPEFTHRRLIVDFATRSRLPSTHAYLGYVEGRNLVIEYRDAEGKFERLPALAAELVALKVDVIVAPSAVAALAAKQATRTLPIVFAGLPDPVTSRLVTSLARPGGNVTGLSILAPELIGKCLEQLTQAVPGVSRVAALWEPGVLGERLDKDMLKRAEGAARALGVRLQFVEARGPEDFDKAFSEMTRARAGALTVLPSPMLNTERRRLVDLAAKNRLPAVYPWRESVDAGGLMSYGQV